MLLLLLLIFTLYNQQLVFCYEGELTVIIEAGKTDCFYQFAKTDDTIDIEYQVIDGGHGDLDINFQLIESNGRILLSDYKKSENVHRIKIENDGNYRFCFDNSFSTFNKKTVFFEITIENDNNLNNIGNDNDRDSYEFSPEEIYEIKIQDIMDYITRIHNLLTKSRQLQDIIKSHEARDRNIVEENFFKVNTWSIFQICFMIIIGGLQVYMVRSIFETNCKVNTIFKKLNL